MSLSDGLQDVVLNPIDGSICSVVAKSCFCFVEKPEGVVKLHLQRVRTKVLEQGIF